MGHRVPQPRSPTFTATYHEPAPSRSSTSPVLHLGSQTDANVAHCNRCSAFLYKQRKLAFSIYKD